jgi:hypothetical protein
VHVDPFTLPLSVPVERARVVAVLDMLIAVTALLAGSEWLRGEPRPAHEQEQRTRVSARDEPVARARSLAETG